MKLLEPYNLYAYSHDRSVLFHPEGNYKFDVLASKSKYNHLLVFNLHDTVYHNQFSFDSFFFYLFEDAVEDTKTGFLIVDMEARRILQVDLDFFRLFFKSYNYPLNGNETMLSLVHEWMERCAELRQKTGLMVGIILRKGIKFIDQIIETYGYQEFDDVIQPSLLSAWEFKKDEDGWELLNPPSK